MGFGDAAGPGGNEPIPVDVHVPGRHPTPEALYHGFLLLHNAVITHETTARKDDVPAAGVRRAAFPHAARLGVRG